MRGLEGRTLLLTGAASGIGAATLGRLVAEGARVVAADINEVGLLETVANLSVAPERLKAIPFDLGEEESIRELAVAAISWLGSLDGLVNVAADLSRETMLGDVDVDKLSRQLWERVLRINLIGSATLIREVIEPMAGNGGGSVVNISSAAAWLGWDYPAYSSSKIGLHALTRHIARKWGPKNIRCNAIAPGLVLTDTGLATTPQEAQDAILGQLCLPRLGKPDDIASMVAFLVSDESSWLTGQIISVDGGHTLRE